MILHALAIIALIWVVILAVGTGFGILAKLIWLGILLSVIAAIWGFIKRNG